MKRIVIVVSCLLMAPAAFAEEAPGDKWVECKVGHGGRASAEQVYREVAGALDKGDVAALRALTIDRCPLFRVATTAGYEFAAGLQEGRDGVDWDKVVVNLQARLQVEGVKLATTPFEVRDPAMNADDVWDLVFPLPVATVATRADMRLQITVTAMSIDGRWFLYEVPTMTGSDAVIDKRYGVLISDLVKRLGKLQGDKAVAVVDAWHKKHQAELAKLGQAAAATKSAAPRKAMALLEASLKRKAQSDIASLGAVDPVLAKRLEGLGLSPKRSGIASCDEYMIRMERCIPMFPPEVQATITEAMAQAVLGWRSAIEASPEAAAALESACKTALDTASTAMQGICPGW